jgi:DNA-directed RNA polymerase subunit E'/Rpb7
MKKIIVESKFLNENIDNYIETYLKNKVEGKCIDEGYIKENSVKILKKSVGKLLGSRFTGDITYEILYTANVCKPIIGNVIDCNVKSINKLGILGNNGPITIIVAKQFHTNENSFNKISENDVIKVEVIETKYSLNDKEIKIIAKLWDNTEYKKNSKKDLTSSDLTPILQDNDFVDNDNQEDFEENSEDNDHYSIEEEDDEEEDDISLNEEQEDIKLENPIDDDIGIEDIELDDSSIESDDDIESIGDDYE